MLHRALLRYQGLARAVEVRRFEHTARTYALVAVVTFKDASILYIRDYLFADGSHRYAYHWQHPAGELIGRWDNEAHWPSIRTFPHHFHAASGGVEASSVRCIDDVIAIIASALS